MTVSTDQPTTAEDLDDVAPPPDDPSLGPVLLRRQRLLPLIGGAAGRGLEIGPLCAPIVSKETAEVCYVDVQSTEDLREHYRGDPSVPAARIVDVDVALYAEGRLRPIADATSGRGPFSWAVACHVVEHVPDVIGWMADLAETLEDGGRLALVVPDRRYTFDARRPPTTTGQLLAAHLRRDQRPSVRAVYDHFSATVSVSTHALWRGAVPGPEDRANPPEVLSDALRRHRESDEYIDVHTWVVDPHEFVGQLAELSELGLLDFVVEHVITTPVDELEFYVVLRRLPRGLSPAERLQETADGFRCPDDEQLPPPPLPEPEPVEVLPPGVELRPVTDKEWALVSRKRTALAPLVSVLSRIRTR